MWAAAITYVCPPPETGITHFHLPIPLHCSCNLILMMLMPPVCKPLTVNRRYRGRELALPPWVTHACTQHLALSLPVITYPFTHWPLVSSIHNAVISDDASKDQL